MNKERSTFFGNMLRGVRGRINKSFNKDHKKAGLNWYKIKKLKHLPYNHPHSYKFLDAEISFNNGPELLHSLHEIFVEDIYDISFTTPSPLVIDCGANIGLSVLYMKTKYPAAKIVAFEPDAINFSFLKKNVAAYHLTDVELRNEAVWKENTTLQFVSGGTLDSKLDSSANHKNTVPVTAIRLKDLLNQKVDFLKIDIEGAEYEVLKDCGTSLKNVEYLFIEYHGFFEKIHELTETLQHIQENGFAYYIKEASNVYPTPFERTGPKKLYDIQQNIFCFRIKP